MKTIFKEECGSCKRVIQKGEEIIHEYSKNDGTCISARQALDLPVKDFRCESICSNCQGKRLSPEDMELLKKCDGVHGSVEEIIDCKSCEVLLK